MKRLMSPLVAVVAVALTGGCGIGPHVDDYNDALVASALAECTCGGLAYGSEEECRAKHPPDAGDQACIEALFKNADGDFEAHLECRTDAGHRYAACMNSSSCTDIIGRLACLAERASDVADCPDLPADVQRDHNECLN